VVGEKKKLKSTVLEHQNCLIAVFKMSGVKPTKMMFVMLLSMLTLSWAMGKTLGQPGEKDHLISELDVSTLTDKFCKIFSA